MPEALATTKRKFHKLLDSLSSASQSSTSPHRETTENISPRSTKTPSIRPPSIPPPSAFRASKRFRPSTSTRSSNSAFSSLRSRLDNNASSASLPRKLPANSNLSRSVNDALDSKTPPNFSPWSQESFLARLKTFSRVSHWHPKPEQLSEVEWAKRGWVCVDVNTVGCRGGCEKRVVVKVEGRGDDDDARVGRAEGEGAGDDDATDDNEGFEQGLADRYKALMIDGHAESCLWRKTGSKDDIYRLPLVRPSVWQPGLRERFQSLLFISKSISKVTFKGLVFQPPTSLPPERILQHLPTGTLGIAPVATLEDQIKAFSIALHGWSGNNDSGNELLHCGACFQRIGLWMYQPDYRRPGSSATAEGGEGEDDPVFVDLVELHREHCPWRNASSQRATGTLEGLNACEVLLRVTSTYAKEQIRKSNDARGLSLSQESDISLAQCPPVAAGDLEEAPSPDKEEVARLDKERESRLRKLKKVFTIKRKTTTEV
ncbi:zf-C3HC-domain-containing protein [Polychaeton citri CBS 116435]|uniref:Zf-C3HC-domain-containing protein n=1 Tax=Polychaeton citri CBS 116435 TaxID=1314669 RepID=A0A9P4Q1Y8_9PEZI|nr:zf-C3HC-domain-containing protein [Polychaeton citri CBS 116435]